MNIKNLVLLQDTLGNSHWVNPQYIVEVFSCPQKDTGESLHQILLVGNSTFEVSNGTAEALIGVLSGDVLWNTHPSERQWP
jgi:hypothetical protein